MLSHLRGTIHAKEMLDGAHDKIVLEVAGVGFEITVSRRTLLTLGQIGEEVTIQTQLCIRENEWIIFGFANQDEGQMFRLLQSVSGVGPKSALALVGTLGPQTIADAIENEDHKLISQAPGVGPKLAQRIALELKTKIQEWQKRQGLQAASSGPENKSAVASEVKYILDGLGYTATEINMALKQCQSDHVQEDVELLVKSCLKILGQESDKVSHK